MGRIIRNAEFRDIAFKMLLLLAAVAILFSVVCIAETNTLHRKIIEQGAAVVGKAIEAHPELAPELIGAVVMPASPEDIGRGKAALASYGYDESSPISIDPILGGLFPGVYIVILGFVVLCAAAMLGLTAHGYALIYKKVRTISDAAEKVVDGNFTALLPAGGEGDFEILGHRFNQMANRLKLGMEQLVAEKVFLKNIISDISHQLKTPLSSLVVYNDLMAEDEDMDADHRRKFIQMGRQQLQRLEWLIQSLLKMARLEAGSIEFRRDRVMLGDVADAAVTALGTMTAEAGVTVAVRQSDADVHYFGDAAWLTEAVINILKNGIEHTHTSGSIVITLDQTALTASLVISDNGEGISREDLPHIFERFYRSSRSVKPNSIGIGLAMSKAIVEGQGGSILVKSEIGKGSEFTIVFLKTLGER